MIAATRQRATRVLASGLVSLAVLVGSTLSATGPARADDNASGEPAAQVSASATPRPEAKPEESPKPTASADDSVEPSPGEEPSVSATSAAAEPDGSGTPETAEPSGSAVAEQSAEPAADSGAATVSAGEADGRQAVLSRTSIEAGGRTVVRAAAADATSKTYPGTSDASVTFTAPTRVVAGDTVTVSGTGWTNTAGTAGSVIGIKLDEGAVSATFDVTNPVDGKVQANKTIWAIAQADATGRWTATFPLPTAANSNVAWTAGETHSFRLLTGSLLTGDKVRTEAASFAIVAAGSQTCSSGEITVADTSGGQTATVCIQQAVTTSAGSTIAIHGDGWLTRNGQGGSTVVLKLASRTSSTAADFQFVHAGGPGDAILAHPVNGNQDPTIWAIVQADAKGDFAAAVPVPASTNVPSNVDAAAGTLAAGHKLVVHVQSGLLDADTQHTIDSAALVVDGLPYPGDQDGAVTACTQSSSSYEAHLLYPDGQTENATTGPVADYGQTLRLVGTGWCNSDPAKGGSTIAIKIDEGAYSRRAGELVNANPQVWQIVEVTTVDGSFDVTVTLPKPGNVAGGSTPAFGDGVHTLRLLTGSLKPGDPIRTLQTGPFTVGTYRPNGIPAPVEAKEDLTSATRHGVTVSVGATSVAVTIPGAKAGDWAFLTAYLADGSVRYPWTTWFQADGRGVVTAGLSGATLPSGSWKLAVQRPDGSLLGWASVTVAPSADADSDTGTTTSTTVVTGAAVVTAAATAEGSAPTTTPEPPPFADAGDLTAKNAGGVTGTQHGSIVTVTLPGKVQAGSWVFLYVYSTPTAVGWVQVDAKRQVKVDLSLMEPGLHKIAVLDENGKLIGWASATVPVAGSQPPAGSTSTQDSVGGGPAVPAQPIGGQGSVTAADAGLIGVAVAVLLGTAAALAIRRRRLGSGPSGPGEEAS